MDTTIRAHSPLKLLTRWVGAFFAAALISTSPLTAQQLGPRDVSVMTRNLYFGAQIEVLMTASDMLDLMHKVEVTWQAVHATDFQDRAKALADEIARTRPQLIGLQEAALWRYQSPGDLLLGGTVPATDVKWDYVQILIDEVAKRGLKYEVLVSIDHMDVELPSITGDDIRLTDRDVILARVDLPCGRLQVVDTDSGHFETLLNLQIGGVGGPIIPVLRGWVSADVKLNGKHFRFVNTHLEDAYPPIQEAQAAELLAGPTKVEGPIITVGDFNSDAYGEGTQSYEMMLEAGFTDAWLACHPCAPGLTWGNDADLLNEQEQYSQRLDLILFRGNFWCRWAFLVGEDLDDRTESGLWPSDHAGVVASLWLLRRQWWCSR